MHTPFITITVLVLPLLCLGAGPDAPVKPAPGAMNEAAAKAQPGAIGYAIVVTGGELLEGALPDSHTCFIARTLRPLGLRCVGSMIVDDRPAEIKAALRWAQDRAKLVIVTGGLGPTENDVTRETLAECTGIALAEHEDVLRHMEQRFKTPRDQLRPNLRKQTQTPTRGTYLKNAAGTAVGLVFERAEGVIVALPGPPRELQPMVREELVPLLRQRFGTRPPGCSLLLRFVGVGQSQISHTLDTNRLLAPEIDVFSTFEGMRVDYRFALADDTPANHAKLAELKQQVVKHLGDFVYADDDTTLEEHVARLLAARGETLALAEVGSGGGLAAGLNAAATAPRVLTGAHVAPTEQRLRQMFHVPDGPWGKSQSSAERTRLLTAAVAADATGSSWAMGVGEALGDGENRSVEVVFRLPDGRTEGQRVSLRGTGDLARFHLTTQLLDLLRRRLRAASCVSPGRTRGG
jgi:nicotinamide-nucleotide amidase